MTEPLRSYVLLVGGMLFGVFLWELGKLAYVHLRDWIRWQRQLPNMYDIEQKRLEMKHRAQGITERP